MMAQMRNVCDTLQKKMNQMDIYLFVVFNVCTLYKYTSLVYAVDVSWWKNIKLQQQQTWKKVFFANGQVKLQIRLQSNITIGYWNAV